MTIHAAHNVMMSDDEIRRLRKVKADRLRRQREACLVASQLLTGSPKLRAAIRGLAADLRRQIRLVE